MGCWILLGEYKPDQLREHMKNISPENCVAFLSSQSFESKYSFNLEKYTGPKYRVDDLDVPFIPNKIHGLELPIPNRFITTDFTLKHSLTSSLRQLQSDAHGELWFKGQGSFHSSKTIMPKGSIKLSFKQTNAYSQSKMHLYQPYNSVRH